MKFDQYFLFIISENVVNETVFKVSPHSLPVGFGRIRGFFNHCSRERPKHSTRCCHIAAYNGFFLVVHVVVVAA